MIDKDLGFFAEGGGGVTGACCAAIGEGREKRKGEKDVIVCMYTCFSRDLGKGHITPYVHTCYTSLYQLTTRLS